MNRITQPTTLLDSKGNIANAGYSTHLYYQYNRKDIKASKLAVKEWDFYQISDQRYVVQMTIGHVSYCSSVSANIIDMQTGYRYSCTSMKLLPSLNMNVNGELPYLQAYRARDFVMLFDVQQDIRHLSLEAIDGGKKVIFDVTLTNCCYQKDKMVIATPFAKKGQFYLNYKENCYNAVANISIGGDNYTLGVDSPAYGLLDWGRGVWPFQHQWVWGNGSCKVEGKYFGFNIGYGFGNNSNATENMFFWDNTAHKLHQVTVERQGDYMSDWQVSDDQGRFNFSVQPIFDNYTTTKLLFVNNSCHQVFGKWSGYVVLDNGDKLTIPPFVAFCEWANNRW